MKHIIAVILVVLGTSQARALSVDQIRCADEMGNSLFLERETNETLRGILWDNGNTAQIECERGGWGSLTFQAPIVCTGPWAYAIGAYGKVVKRSVTIQMEMSSGTPLAAKAEYKSNWLGISGGGSPTRSLECVTELGH